MARRRRPPRSGAIAELPPMRILGQIAALQTIYYVVALVLMVFTMLVSGQRFTLDLVFGWSSLRGDNTQGWLLAFIWLCCSGAIVAAMVLIVSRSKLILDFAITLHFIHLVIVTLSSGLVPRTAFWWGTMVASCAVTTVGGTYGCRWRELQPINFGGRSTGATNANGTAGDGSSRELGGSPGGAGDSHGDEEMGFSRGRGRGRGRDGGGEYEMVGIKAGENR
ncbi:integral membrane protein S linking to the trans Golgi network-domain-containing protein [Microdochium trichocladiopsis]|uniref:Integral membrane protein S linking to the trans Golgi network-domain-containing protein n=1 Tax=Microdochium trichocladiopsis TaxID=1682393 RepID=A0A9P8Y640_9PEZI|nr:integral membrane protein S linking to the trans Golgi network-domain-containing protein [Microdochium trichocladiopsis]KAH7029098.1 integral membrane protein S linking to the trans Golgi network-domain-containing protein [Microdochium trichocladiopsis]